LGEKGQISVKPAWLGMSRLTTNKEYKDFDQPGDRTLAVQMGRGFYHFSTYNMQPLQTNVNANINY
jgi:protein transport protein SEC24